jgi:uncharacterized membrane protein
VGYNGRGVPLLVTAYQFYLTVHILASIVWVGGAMITQVYAARAQATGDPDRIAGFASDAEFVGRTMFAPSAIALVIFGFLLVHEGNWGLGSGWIDVAIVVWIASFVVGIAFLGPESGRIGRLIEQRGAASPEVRRRIDRIFLISRVELLFLLIIVVDMVTKPGV